eukprot:tig00021758_g23398.t1
MVRRPCSTTPEISDQRLTHASALSHAHMYAVVRERIRSCGTRLRATLLTEHIHGQTGEPFFIGGNQVGVPARAASPPPSAPRAVQDHEAGAPISSCMLRVRGRDVATAPFQRWLSANDFSGAAVCGSWQPAPGPGLVPAAPPRAHFAPLLEAGPAQAAAGRAGPVWPADEDPFRGELGGLRGAPGGPPHAGGGAVRPTRLG